MRFLLVSLVLLGGIMVDGRHDVRSQPLLRQVLRRHGGLRDSYVGGMPAIGEWRRGLLRARSERSTKIRTRAFVAQSRQPEGQSLLDAASAQRITPPGSCEANGA